jgi:hypothetical protein
VAAAVVLTGALAAGAAGGGWDGGRAPFAWPDVAAAHLVCALPLALMIAAAVGGRVPAAGVLAVAVGCLAAGLTPVVGGVDTGWYVRLGALAGVVVRSVSALGLVTGAVLSAAVLAGRAGPPAPGGPARRRAAAAVLGTAALLGPPASYTDARGRHDLLRFGDLMEQSRAGEARALAHGLVVLDPGAEWNGRPLPEVAGALDRTAAELERRVAAPLGPYATTRDRVGRATTLAVLGRTAEALAVLGPVDDPAAAADVENLRGTILETRGEWEPGLASYHAARAAWERRPPSPARAAGVLRAATGAAYCLRKAGRYTEAEAAYLEILELSPTADSHFLLAQFYDDSQRAAAARDHARRAIDLAPDRYRAAGERLIRQLALSQFGCLGVYTAERSVTGPIGTDLQP